MVAPLAENIHDPRLRTHHLKGPMAGRLVCSASYDVRIVFRLETCQGQEAVLLVSVGTCDEVY